MASCRAAVSFLQPSGEKGHEHKKHGDDSPKVGAHRGVYRSPRGPEHKDAGNRNRRNPLPLKVRFPLRGDVIPQHRPRRQERVLQKL